MYILEYSKFKDKKDTLSGIALVVDDKICLVLPKKFEKQNKYSIPKGHQELNISPFHNAYNELVEETGIDIGLTQPSESFKFTYKKNGVKKNLMVFVIKLTSEEYENLNIRDRNESEIAEVKFLTKEEALTKVEKYYKRLIRYIFK